MQKGGMPALFLLTLKLQKLMILNRIQGAESIEIKIDSVKQKFYIPDNDVLRNKNILYVDVMSTGYSYSNRKITNDLISLVLTYKNKEFINRMSSVLLRNNVDIGYRHIINSKIDIEKCYFTSSVSSADIGQSFVLTFYYGDYNPLLEVPKTNNYELLLLRVNSLTQNKFYFDQNDNIKNNLVYGMQFDPLSVSNNARDASFLTLVNNKRQTIINKVPLREIQYIYDFKPFDFLQIDWTNSFVEIADTSYNSTSHVYRFHTFYLDKDEMEQFRRQSRYSRRSRGYY